MKKFFITTPIFYVNDVPHIGHTYSVLAADMLARFHRVTGDEVFFLTGTDEHGSKIAEAAAKKGVTPQVFADDISAKFKQTWQDLGISFDYFIRTTDQDHLDTVKDLLTRLNKSGYVYKGEYSGLYCRGCESFKRPEELIDGKCPDHHTVPEKLSEPTYFFKLSAFQQKLIELISSDTFKVQPQIRKNEVLAFLKDNELEDIAISRQNVEWGVPLPWDDKFTVYVWIDALINYYTAGKKNNSWPPTLHILAKDILRFHCIIWPALLLAIKEELPKEAYVHGFFTVEGKKISKSLGNAISPLAIIEKYPIDALRLFLFKAFPFGNDGEYSEHLLEEVYTSALSNELGNLVQRVVVMVQKYFDSEVPDPGERKSNLETAIVSNSQKHWRQALENTQIDQAFNAVWDLVRFANQRIDETKPWDLAKTDQAHLAEVMYELVEILHQVSMLLLPLLPETAHKIAKSVGVSLQNRYTEAEFDEISSWGYIRPGRKVVVGEVLFPRHAG